MAKFSIRNITAGSVTLPFPYNVLLPPGKSVVVADTEANILANLGGPAAVLGVVRVEEVAESSIVTQLPVSADDVAAAFVYRPGATDADAPGGNVYTDWNLLMVALDATSKLGLRTIEFDSRFDPSGAAVIPAGGPYNMTNTNWVSTGISPVVISLADGVLFATDPPSPNGSFNCMRFEGPFMIIIGNRVAGPAPFTDIDIRVSGTVVRFEQNPALGPVALPMFAVTPAGGEITIVFDSPRGGLGGFPASLFIPPGPPLIDTGTDIVSIRAAAGIFANDIVTGSGFLSLSVVGTDAWGDIFNEFDQPNFTGVLDQYSVGIQVVRSNIYTPPGTPFGPVDATWGPYDATYNETVLVDTSLGPVTINLPNANTNGVQAGERVTVKDVGGVAGNDKIILASGFGNAIEGASITINGGSKTWEMDGVGNWWQTNPDAFPAAPLITMVYRPDDPLGSRDNVYVTWGEVYAAIQATAGRGIRYVQFDSRFSTHIVSGLQACPIPAGTWDMTDVVWTALQFQTSVEILGGAILTNLTSIWSQTLLRIIFNAPIPAPSPFTDPSILLSGPVRMINTVAGASPMFRCTTAVVQSVIAMGAFGEPALGGGTSGTSAFLSPLVEVQAGATLLQGISSGWINNNCFSGTGTIIWRLRDDSSIGGENPFQTYDFPAFTGVLTSIVAHRDRHLLSSVVTVSPFNATYNQLVRVDTTGGAIVVNLPLARRAYGERVVVKDYVGSATLLNNITVAGASGDLIDGAPSVQITAAYGALTFISNGIAGWMVI